MPSYLGYGPYLQKRQIIYPEEQSKRGTSQTHFIRKMLEAALRRNEDVTKNEKSWDAENSRTNPGKQ